MRKIASLLCAAALCLGLLAGCAPGARPEADDGKARIVATLFPQYDFARRIAGDRARVSMLLLPGVESHSYEPTPADIVRIDRSDLFLYTGDSMEPWVEGMVAGMSGHARVVNVSAGVRLDAEGGHEGHDHGAHEHGRLDPHIWTSPLNAKVMVRNISDALCEADPGNADYYAKNTARYLAELDALDEDFLRTVETAKRREIVFGGRFALHYFAERYGLEYLAAFDSCSSETEPSVRVMAQIIDEMREKQIPVIFYEELTDPKVSRAIAGETGARLLLLHSCHNVSKDELEGGATYLSLMRQNLTNLKEGLN